MDKTLSLIARDPGMGVDYGAILSDGAEVFHSFYWAAGIFSHAPDEP